MIHPLREPVTPARTLRGHVVTIMKVLKPHLTAPLVKPLLKLVSTTTLLGMLDYKLGGCW